MLVRLRSQRIQPVPAKIKEKGKGLDRDLNIPGFGESIKQRDIVIFTRQLATMIDAGLPIVQCLDILAAQSPSKKLRGRCARSRKRWRRAARLPTRCASIRSSSTICSSIWWPPERSAAFSTASCTALAGYMEKAMRLKSKIKGAMIYPVTIVTVAVGVTAILLIFVIPVFAELFSSFGKELPAPTQFVINLSNFILAYYRSTSRPWRSRLGSPSANSISTERGRLTIDHMLLQLPVFGDLIRKSAVARFTRTLSTLVSSGVPILDALDDHGAHRRKQGRRARRVGDAREHQRRAHDCRAADGSKVFPPMVCQMISVGETTGALDAMLQKIADFYEDEVDNAVANLTALMEPLIILFLGVVIGGLVISMYLPIFKLGSVIS